MRAIHGLGILLAITGILLVMLLPFFPGRYDSLAVPLSVMTQMFGFVGILLVPLGILSIASGRSSVLARYRHGIATAALVALSFVWLCVSIGAVVTAGFALAFGTLTFGVYAVSRIVPQLKGLQGAAGRSTHPVAYYMVVVPVAVTLLRSVVLPPAIDFSRARAIRNSEPLIADIEQYRVEHGRYPPSLLAEGPDYLPGIIGIPEYRYEPRGDAYNLVFEQFAQAFGTREFVVFNPRDQHVMTAHANDLLRLSDEQLALEHTRGHYAVHDLPYPHWKYFWFD